MSDDERIASILGEWQMRCDQGETVPPEEVITAHPELADELRARFAALDAFDEALAGVSRRLRSLPDDRYTEFKPVGEGGMGIVFWAIDTDLNREVAFKVVRPGMPEGAEATFRAYYPFLGKPYWNVLRDLSLTLGYYWVDQQNVLTGTDIYTREDRQDQRLSVICKYHFY